MGKAQIGIHGFGTMARALALNMADHGRDVAVTNRETDWIAPFMTEAAVGARSWSSERETRQRAEAVLGGGAVHGGHPVPALSAGLAWYDSMRLGQGRAIMIQAQRDMFGHHGFERLGQAGRHHGPWWTEAGRS